MQSLLSSKKLRLDKKKIEKDTGFNFFTGTKEAVKEAHKLWQVRHNWHSFIFPVK
jgi:hypothetical protein